MKKSAATLLILLSTIIIFITGCGSGGGGGGSEARQCVISLYGSQSSTGISIQADVNFDSSATIVPIDIYINGTKVTTTNSNSNWVGYSYELAGTFVPGDLIHVKISRDSWGEVEYDMQVCGTPDQGYLDAITYNPSLDTLLENIDDGLNDYTKLEITLPETEITGMNNVTSFIRSPDSYAHSAALAGKTLSYDLGTNNSTWTRVRDSIIAKRRSASLYLTFQWSGDYKIGAKADIHSYYTGLQTSEDFSLPRKVEGTYNLTANYTAQNAGGDTITGSNYTDILGITRDFRTLAITGKTGVTGEVKLMEVNLL